MALSPGATMMRSICTAIFAFALSLEPAMAQKAFTAEDLIKSLQASGGSSSNSVDVDSIRRDLKNSISVEPVSPVAGPVSRSIAVIEQKPNINIEVFFDYNSAAIKPESMAQLHMLGQALQDSRLSSGRFLIAGHTDGAGSREYNLKLSQERADAIRRFLVAAFPIESARLAAVGFGKEQLRDAANPEAAINRRVQIVNIGN